MIMQIPKPIHNDALTIQEIAEFSVCFLPTLSKCLSIRSMAAIIAPTAPRHTQFILKDNMNPFLPVDEQMDLL
ncbi:MAG: hypothetical protein ABR990_12555, partial [Terracidiphilus sp.]